MKKRMMARLLAAAIAMVPVAAQAGLKAEIRWTRYGVPHVKAKDYAGLGYGYGYAVARDRLCLFADRMLTLRGVRSRYHGAEGRATVGFLPASNLDLDIFHKVHLSDAIAGDALARLDKRTRDMARGYAAGFNRYVKGDGKAAAAACASPVLEMKAEDVVRTMMAIGSIWKAFQIAPFGAASAWGNQASVAQVDMPQGVLPPGIGSNAWAFGAKATGEGAIVLANPHSRWGADQWLLLHQLHLTIDGEIDVAGADFAGLPMPVIGFNKDVAWSVEAPSTVSFYVMQAMTVKEGAKPAYVVDGVERPLTIRPIIVEKKQADGSIAQQEVALAWSDLGPLYRLPAMPGRPAGWYAVTDAGAGNARGLDQLLAVARTSTIADFARATAENRGMGAHFVGGDRQGNTSYVEAGPLLGITDAALADCRVKDAAPIVLDGSRSSCWVRGPDGAPLLAAVDGQPSIVTRGVVQNTNNSYHRSVPGEAIGAYSILLGSPAMHDPRLPMSDRRLGEIMKDGKASADEVLSIVYDNRNFAAETSLDTIIAACASTEVPAVKDGCTILGRWDRRNDSDSRGALLFAELWAGLVKARLFHPSTAEAMPAPDASARIVATLAETVARLQALGLRGDEPWGRMLARITPSGRIPLHGGADDEGVLNALGGGALTAEGYGSVVSGTGYLQLVRWIDGKVDAQAVLAHGQSIDPASPHFGDQLDIFREKRLVRVPFTEAEIAGDTDYRIERISER